MDWIKATPDTMPPDMNPLLVTMNLNGEKTVFGPVRKRGDIWEAKYFDRDSWLFIRGEVITHWQLMPEPAEDS